MSESGQNRPLARHFPYVCPRSENGSSMAKHYCRLCTTGRAALNGCSSRADLQRVGLTYRKRTTASVYVSRKHTCNHGHQYCHIARAVNPMARLETHRPLGKMRVVPSPWLAAPMARPRSIAEHTFNLASWKPRSIAMPLIILSALRLSKRRRCPGPTSSSPSPA